MANSNDHTVSELVETTLKNLQQLVSANAIIGEPLTMPDGSYVVPISKISFGYGTGGTDIPSQKPGEHFGGGGGGGGTIEPIGFLTIREGDIKLLQVNTADNTADRIVNLIPQMFDKITGLIDEAKQKKAAKEGQPQEGQPAEEKSTGPAAD